MAIRIPTDQVQNLQQMEAVVAGPDGANRLYTVTGQLTNYWTQANGQPNVDIQQTQTYTVLLGPVFTRQQFYRAVATASVIATTLNVNTPQFTFGWTIALADADWDDESGQVELRIEVNVRASGQNNVVSVNGLGFQVTILAALPA